MTNGKPTPGWPHRVERFLRRQRDGLLAGLLRRTRPWDLSVVRKARFKACSGQQEYLLAYRHGDYFIVSTRDAVIGNAVYASAQGGFDFHKFERALGVLGAGFRLDTLVDVGANIGTICIPAVRRGLAARAIAIEPEPQNFRLLAANVLVNDLVARIQAHALALAGADTPSVRLALSPDSSGNHRVAPAASTVLAAPAGSAAPAPAAAVCAAAAGPAAAEIAVPATTLDALVPSLPPERSLIWIDTEGYEGVILSGAQRAVAARVPLVVEFTPQFMQLLQSYAPLRQALLRYERYHDLGEALPRATAMSAAALDALWQRYSGTRFQTDLLVT